MILVVILLAIIAYFLWKIYNQREQEKTETKAQKFLGEHDREKQEVHEKYPHLVGKVEHGYLMAFANVAKKGVPVWKGSWMSYVQVSTKIDFSPGARDWDNLWFLGEELLEHLDKYHEGSPAEHELAICIYWQVAAEAGGKLAKENPQIDEKKFDVPPYTNIEKIASWFSTHEKHPTKEISFRDEKGYFPRKSEGSVHVRDKLKGL
jgi:hypothetical protein